MKRLAYKGWQNCYQIENGDCKMIATADIGPRIVHLSRGDGENLLKLFENQMVRPEGMTGVSMEVIACGMPRKTL